MVCHVAAIFSEDKNTTEPAYKVKNALSIPNTPEPTTTQEPLVGSQKRKARKTKITHLVRTADGKFKEVLRFKSFRIAALGRHENTKL